MYRTEKVLIKCKHCCFNRISKLRTRERLAGCPLSTHVVEKALIGFNPGYGKDFLKLVYPQVVQSAEGRAERGQYRIIDINTAVREHIF